MRERGYPKVVLLCILSSLLLEFYRRIFLHRMVEDLRELPLLLSLQDRDMNLVDQILFTT